jgi:RimJ/RimL family protein N-acetyltransferase
VPTHWTLPHLVEEVHPRPTESITLRDVIDEDLEIFYRHQADPVSVALAQVPARDQTAHLARWTRLRADPAVVAKTITVNGTVVGHLMSFNRDGVREVGYWLGRRFWGRGIARAALQQFLSVEVERPLFAIVAAHNTASRHVLTRCRFQEIGVQANVVRYQLSAD